MKWLCKEEVEEREESKGSQHYGEIREITMDFASFKSYIKFTASNIEDCGSTITKSK